MKETTTPRPPWETNANEARFSGYVIAFSGRFELLRKQDVVEVLTSQEGAKVGKLGKATNLFVHANQKTTDRTRADKLLHKGAELSIVDEHEFRMRYLLPTEVQAAQMLSCAEGRKRLAKLFWLTREDDSSAPGDGPRVTVTGAQFSGLDLGDTELRVDGLVFKDCALSGTGFGDKWYLYDAKRSSFRLSKGINTHICRGDECDFSQSAFSHATLESLHGCRFERADLYGARFFDAQTECVFDQATLKGAKWVFAEMENCSFVGANLQKVTHEGHGSLRNCTFEDADLRSVTFKGTSGPLVFEACRFRNTDLRNATLMNVRFENCDLTGALFDGARLDTLAFVDTDTTLAQGLVYEASDKGHALQTLEKVAPSFKQIEVSLKLNVGDRKVACSLNQFDHGRNSAGRQAWLAGEDYGDLRLSDAIATFGRLFPGARVDKKSLLVKSVKGNVAPALKPKELEHAVLSAFFEALPTTNPSPSLAPLPSFASTAFTRAEGLARWLPLMGRPASDEDLRLLLQAHGVDTVPKVPRGSCSTSVVLEDCGLIFEHGDEFPMQQEHSSPEMLVLKGGTMNPQKGQRELPYRLSRQDRQREVRQKLGLPDREDDFMPYDEWDLEGRVLRVDYDDEDDNRISYLSFDIPPIRPLTR